MSDIAVMDNEGNPVILEGICKVSCGQGGAEYLSESSSKKFYTDRGIRKILSQYSKKAGIKTNISPRALRNFLFAWMKKNDIDDALIQPYSGL